MKKRLQGLLAGILIGSLMTGIGTFAINTTTFYDVVMGGIKIVLNGKQLRPADAQGNTVEPFIYNGTTYLPVRAVADALGLPVSWDGPNYTVYLGDMDGKLESPTLMLKDAVDIDKDSYFRNVDSATLVDNYGNSYGNALGCARNEKTFQTLLNGKYSKFKGTLYVPKDYIVNKSIGITIEADGKQLYVSPQMNKTSKPIDFEVDVSNYNDFKIICHAESYSGGYSWGHQAICIGDAGFYQ